MVFLEYEFSFQMSSFFFFDFHFHDYHKDEFSEKKTSMAFFYGCNPRSFLDDVGDASHLWVNVKARLCMCVAGHHFQVAAWMREMLGEFLFQEKRKRMKV